MEGHEAFLAVMKSGSLSGAARQLGLAQPTVRRRLERLEHALGTPLFVRPPRGLVPTAAAERGLPHALAVEASARAFERTAAGAEKTPRGVLRVSASEVVAAEVLPPVVAALGRTHPGLVVELQATDATVDLLRRDADVAVRMLRPTQAALVTKRAATIPVGLHASPEYLAHHGHPQDADALRHHRFVGADRRPGLREAMLVFGVDLPPRAFVFRSDSDLVQLAAVRAGVGIGACQVPCGARDRGLVAVLPSLVVPLEAWVVTHEDLRRVPRVRVVFEALVAGLASYAAEV
ncbi:MAG: LysR family transcriptional regulator [Myxococcota bacterium]